MTELSRHSRLMSSWGGDLMLKRGPLYALMQHDIICHSVEFCMVNVIFEWLLLSLFKSSRVANKLHTTGCRVLIQTYLLQVKMKPFGFIHGILLALGFKLCLS